MVASQFAAGGRVGLLACSTSSLLTACATQQHPSYPSKPRAFVDGGHGPHLAAAQSTVTSPFFA